MTFTAIDFETATQHGHSACAVGIVTVEHSLIVDEYQTLIQPPENYYAYHNIRVHGITAKQTANTATFEDLYPEIYKRLLHKQVVAHNENFDRTVLRKCIQFYGLSSKGLFLHKQWQCTVKLYRSLGYQHNRLSDCCARLNIPLQHHNALSDARACALLYLHFYLTNPAENKIQEIY
ncbi:MAG TPA: 3'-5' exonuclease [Chitinophagales bacterium]|jgi:DNA polymerase-3 subunit epsilon|nr:3'-5' exonuclease [Chitinophagales bacterium]MBP6154939.1 3'-5' exonuclease [Chitinophagales bacterium]HQV76846.1 3'-5' exonuclease [Chitinophagales bacterium]HQW78087.1 3'-5' exonuclease [Chitinophagales bacterium]HRB68090.1 3'-5' exonuclease [Chitinophagales bacterium]